MLPFNHPWYHRLLRSYNQEFSLNQFAGKWLLDLEDVDLTKPHIAICNGWGAEHNENQWYADALSDGIASVFAYDSRGQGNSIAEGDMDAIQSAIDANRIMSSAIDEYHRIASNNDEEPGNFVLEGHCVGAMTVAALFAGQFPVIENVDATILISPVSTFNLPWFIKPAYFLPSFLGNWLRKYFSVPLAQMMVSGENSEYSRQKALMRLHRFDVDAAIKQARQVFWKENVEHLWKYIDKPTLILVAPGDPLTDIRDSAKVYSKLQYPIWVELEAPDHLILEDNIEYLSDLIPKFASKPWDIYEEYRHLSPDY